MISSADDVMLLQLRVGHLEQHIVALNAIIEGYVEQVKSRDTIIAAYEKLHEERKAQA